MSRLALTTLLLATCTLADPLALFDPTLSRRLMLPMSAAAYSDSPQKCVDSVSAGGKVLHQVTKECDYFHDKCSAFVMKNDKEKMIVVAFRGSSNAAQIIVEIQESAFEKHVSFAAGGKVSEYFNDAFLDLWNSGLRDAFFSVAHENPDYNLYITGHSLGGALASLAGVFISANQLFPAERTHVYTYGQPRTGDKTYADIHDEKLKNSFRVTHLRDIVPHVPPEFMDYHHHNTEIFYPNGMEENAPFKTCQAQEDNNCSDSYIDISIDDHTHYYGVQISSYGIGGCV